MSDPAHLTYLLRVWQEPAHAGPAQLRAALTDVSTRETRYFSDMGALARHLRSLQEGAPSDEA